MMKIFRTLGTKNCNVSNLPPPKKNMDFGGPNHTKSTLQFIFLPQFTAKIHSHPTYPPLLLLPLGLTAHAKAPHLGPKPRHRTWPSNAAPPLQWVKLPAARSVPQSEPPINMTNDKWIHMMIYGIHFVNVLGFHAFKLATLWTLRSFRYFHLVFGGSLVGVDSYVVHLLNMLNC